MRTITTGALVLVAAMLIALPAVSQVGHPAKGSWSGYWGPSEDDQRRMLLLLDWRNNEISGTINPGRNGVTIESAALDVDDWMLTIEADMPIARGSDRTAPFEARGKLENLGSWSNRTYSGTYRFGDETGTFALSLN
jgi:hypothetical protein